MCWEMIDLWVWWLFVCMVGDEWFCGVFRDNDLLVRELWLI